MNNLNILEENLNYYFKNRFYLKEALTHRSYAAENNINYDNQRLEFLGDAVVQIIVTDFIYNKYKEKQEGELTSIRSALVNKESLATLARTLKLQNFILLGRGETDAGGSRRVSVLCDVFESIIGAMYLDAGMEVCRKLLLSLIDKSFDDINTVTSNLNPKGYLQEITQKQFQEKPKYNIKDKKGPEHKSTYIVEVMLKDEVLAEGKGTNIKVAEKNAALRAIEILKCK
ncbi:MAG: ribonuclease III [Victivallales bacterium]|nr:ribonuclease III [Victivallales bacterium]MCF7889155.1 ribonuclease III [Victivallales bacterium]